MRRFSAGRAVAVSVLALALAAIPANAQTVSTGGLPTVINGNHMMWGMGVDYPSAQQAQNDLIYHGGAVETKPAVYTIFWGPMWQQGFKEVHNGFTYPAWLIRRYINSFFMNIGGTPWAGVQTQYCDNIDPGQVSCNGNLSAQYITNPKYQLKGTWIDSSAVPSNIVTSGLAANSSNDALANEAIKAAQHFGYNPDATYMIFTQPGTQATAYGTVYCAYHNESSHTAGHGVRYAFIPFVPDQGAGCGMDSVNADDAFGHGYLDGFSIVAGHEYSEAVTDPDNLDSVQDGWNDASTSENGDKCAWTGLQNVTAGSNYYAVQPTWSNEANGGNGGCAVSR